VSQTGSQTVVLSGFDMPASIAGENGVDEDIALYEIPSANAETAQDVHVIFQGKVLIDMRRGGDKGLQFGHDVCSFVNGVQWDEKLAEKLTTWDSVRCISILTFVTIPKWSVTSRSVVQIGVAGCCGLADG
jgi:hypothetical protein